MRSRSMLTAALAMAALGGMSGVVADPMTAALSGGVAPKGNVTPEQLESRAQRRLKNRKANKAARKSRKGK